MSEEEQYDMFCTHCGQRITKETVYCPSCGTHVSDMGGEDAYGGQSPSYRNAYNVDMSPRLKGLGILFIITAVIFIGMGVYYYSMVDSIINEAMNDASWPDLVKQIQDMGYSEQWLIDTMKQYLTIFAVMMIISGAAVAVSAVCAFTKKMWALGLIGCVIATVMSSATFLGLIVGIIATYMYCTTKSCFQN